MAETELATMGEKETRIDVPEAAILLDRIITLGRRL